MKIPIYQVDAFTSKIFGGNPAAVCPLEEWLPDALLQKIALENNLAETAFFISKNDHFHLRWFTPEIEMDLCGHATLAAAHVIFEHLNFPKNSILFDSNSGQLEVTKHEKIYTMNFPSRMPIPASLPDIIQKGIKKMPIEVWKSRDYVLVYSNEEDILEITPDASLLHQINLDPGGIIVTAPGKAVDFVSRFFTPQASIFEDPVTGSAHCSLIPFWAKRLGKDDLTAIQLSSRRGHLFCKNKNGRVAISGSAITFLRGTIFL